MKKEIYFHIGLPKTPTTFLQSKIFNNISDSNFKYLGKYNNLGVKSKLLKTISNNFLYNSVPLNKKKKDQIRKFAFLSQKNLISSEGLSGDLFTRVNRKKRLANIYDCFPEARIILFIRRQDEYARSLYLQVLESGNFLSLAKFYYFATNKNYKPRKYLVPMFDHFLFFDFVNYLNKNSKKLLIIPYEKFKKTPQLIVNQICDFIGLDRFVIKKNKKINSSLGTIRSFFYRFKNKIFGGASYPGLFPGYVPYIRNKKLCWTNFRGVISYLGLYDYWADFLNTFDFKYKDHTGTCKKILEMCKEDNKKLDKKYKLGLKKYGYY